MQLIPGTASAQPLQVFCRPWPGLGDAQDSTAVGTAVAIVYGDNLLPLGSASIFMSLLVRTLPVPANGNNINH